MARASELDGDLRCVCSAVVGKARCADNSGDWCAVVTDPTELACGSRDVDAAADNSDRGSRESSD